MEQQKKLVTCTVNGHEVAEYVDVRESLLEMLRNRLGLTSVKKGCEVGECGACTVIVDGETIDSCIYLAVWAQGKQYPHSGRPHGTEWRTHKNPGGIYRRRRHSVRLLHPGFYYVRHSPSGTRRKKPDSGYDPETYGRKPLPLHGL